MGKARKNIGGPYAAGKARALRDIEKMSFPERLEFANKKRRSLRPAIKDTALLTASIALVDQASLFELEEIVRRCLYRMYDEGNSVL